MDTHTPATKEPIVRTSVHDAVYQVLRNRIMHGVYRAGQVLGIQDIADNLDTSTMPVREALRKLIAQQALEPMRSRSARIPLITPERLADLHRTRLLIEGKMTQWACDTQISPEKLHHLKQLAHDIHQSRTQPDGLTTSLELNRQFHFSIYEYAQSPVMLGIIESLWLQSGPYLREVQELCGAERAPIDDHHETLVDALSRNDVIAAKQALEADISWPFEQLLQLQTASSQ